MATKCIHILSPQINRCALCFAPLTYGGFGEPTTALEAYEEDLQRVLREHAALVREMPFRYGLELVKVTKNGH